MSTGHTLVQTTTLYSTFTLEHTPPKQNKDVSFLGAAYCINLLQWQMNTFKMIKSNQINEETSTCSLTQPDYIFFKKCSL